MNITGAGVGDLHNLILAYLDADHPDTPGRLWQFDGGASRFWPDGLRYSATEHVCGVDSQTDETCCKKSSITGG